jgi:hypothetical protein
MTVAVIMMSVCAQADIFRPPVHVRDLVGNEKKPAFKIAERR